MISNNKRIRIDYAPLNVAVSMEVATPNSPTMQVYNAIEDEYEQDRELTPTKLWPRVNADASDGSWTNRYANTILTNMTWYVDGVLISLHPDWTGTTSDGRALYEMDETVTAYRGSLEVRKNIPPETEYALHFEAVVSDPRLGTNIPIVSDKVILSTDDKSEDGYSISIGDDQIIRYNPFNDRLHLYEYKVAHGLVTASGEAEAATDENAYIRTVTVAVYKGYTEMTSGYTLRLYRMNANGTTEELAAGSDEVVSISATAIVLDLRMVTKSDYIIRAAVNNAVRPDPEVQFSVNRVCPSYLCRPTNGTSIGPDDVMRFDKAMVDSDGKVVECPASIISILWKTETVGGTVQHNEGGTTLFSIAKTGIGKNYDDDWMDIITETDIKPAYSYAVDESGDVLTDESGNELIIN